MTLSDYDRIIELSKTASPIVRAVAEELSYDDDSAEWFLLQAQNLYEKGFLTNRPVVITPGPDFDTWEFDD